MEFELWSREGFVGDRARVRRPNGGVEFLRADGAHVPRRLNAADVALPSESAYEARALLADTTTGVRLSLAQHSGATPFLVRNVECDEMHFVQQGTLRYRTAVGTLAAAAGDFICIPRAVTYQIGVDEGPALTVCLECPTPLRLSTRCHDVLDPERDVERARVEPATPLAGEVVLLIRGGAETTRYLLAHDPLSADEQTGIQPVWKVPLAKVRPRRGPVPFVETDNNNVLLYTLSSYAAGGRPPVHVNADYDEIVWFFRGPGAWGAVAQPGTVTYVPKGIAHQGPSEDVSEGYLAWLLETRSTLRWTADALAAATLMETERYGVHPSATTRPPTHVDHGATSLP